MTVKDDDDDLIKVLAMIAMTTTLVMMMMAVASGWCFLVGAMQSAPDKERLLCIFNFSPRQQVQGFTGVLQGNVFLSKKEMMHWICKGVTLLLRFFF